MSFSLPAVKGGLLLAGFLCCLVPVNECAKVEYSTQRASLPQQTELTSNSSQGFARYTSLDCGQEEECVPRQDCHTNELRKMTAQPCMRYWHGMCCPTDMIVHSRHKRAVEHRHEHMLYSAAMQEGRRQYAGKVREMQRNKRVMTSPGRAEASFHQFLQPTLPESNQLDQLRKDSGGHGEGDVYEDVFVSKVFADATNMTLEQRQSDAFAPEPKRVQKRCASHADCDPKARYRTFDGSCNNPLPERSRWGSANSAFGKFLKPAYEDGVWAPRLHSVTGKPLKSARTITSTVLDDFDNPDHHLNLLFMQFGQFVAHDFSRSSSVKMGKEDIECCSADGSNPLRGEESHFACLPIDVSPHDPFYSKFGVRCLNFVRLALAKDECSKLGYAKQISKVTHFVDASTVYGSSKSLADALRSFRKGQLRNFFPVGIEQLPPNRDPKFCEPWAKICFEAGDDRANQVISLVQVHILFLREHNRLARRLSKINPHWDDETLYQETRRIVIAEVQRIVYNEYLPLVLGWDKAAHYGLPDSGHGHTHSYNPDVKPVAYSDVSGAAFRFGHSTVDGHFRIRHRGGHAEKLPLHTVFNDPSKLLYPESFDDYMHSLGHQPQQQMDHSVTRGLAGFLFAGREPFGSDLPSLNVQRGRDLALAPYNEYRAWTHQPKLRSFQEFGHHGSKLAKVYDSPEDVDLWLGGLLEPAEGDGVVGPTFGHLIGEQFARLKFGDRYYYTNGPDSNPGAFTRQQLAELQKVTLASVICANVDKRFDFHQAPTAFMKSSRHNVPMPCEEYHDLNLGEWKE